MKPILPLVSALFLAGCQFGIEPLAAPPAGVDASTVADLGSTDDLATAAGPDASPVTPDLLDDPCGPWLGPVSDAVTASCSVGTPPVVDGTLLDWTPAQLPTQMRHQTAASSFGSWQDDESDNDADLSARAGLRWDLDFLYLGVEFTDNARSTNSLAFWDNDTIEIYLDGQHDHSDDYGSDDLEMMVRADGEVRFYKDGLEFTPKILPTVKVAERPAPNQGWTLEVALPWQLLGGTAGHPGRRLGFTAQLNDNDNGGLRDRGLIWKNNEPGGCSTCVGSCAPWCNTKSFYDLRLGSRL